MAASKKNRKKGTKRTPSHSAPPGYVSEKPKPLTEKQRAQQDEDMRNHRMNVVRTAGMVVLLIGFTFAYWAESLVGSMHVIGYPISIGGAMMCFFSARNSVPRRLVPQICYIGFILMIILVWFLGSQTAQ